MTCGEFIISLLRPRLHDTDKAGYSDAELLAILEASLLQMYADAAASRKGAFIKNLMVIHYARVPEDFGGFAGQFPVRQQNGRFYILTGQTSLEARYHPAPPANLTLTDDLSLPDKFLPLLLDTASIRALNRNEYNTAPDEAISNRLTASVNEMMRHG